MIFGNDFQVTFRLLIIIIAGAEAKPGNGMFFKQIVLYAYTSFILWGVKMNKNTRIIHCHLRNVAFSFSC